MAQKLEFQFHIKSPDTYQDFTVPLGTTVIGRDPSTNLPLVFPLVSRRHAQLVCTEDECTIMDLGSANGTIVNDLKLEPNVPVKITNQALILIGPFEITCEIIPINDAPVEPAFVESQPTNPDMPVVQAQEPAPLEEVVVPPVEEKIEDSSAQVPEAEVPPEPAKQEGEGPAGGRRRKQAKAAPEEPGEIPPPIPPEPPTSKPLEPEPPKRDLMPPGLSIQSLHLLNYLPGIYQTDFMSRFMALFESILIPIEWNIDNFDLFLDPGTSPISFLPWLANWYEIVYDSSWSEEQRRTLLKEAYQIYSRRGTRWALSRILEIYIGQKPEILEFGSQGGPSSSEPFTFIVKLASGNQNLNKDLIERIIDSSKPAQTTYKLIF